FAASILPAPALPPGMLVPVVRIGPESRLTFSQYAAENGFSAGKLEQRYAATGLLRCNGSVGTAQLTAARDVITTAAHVLFDRSGRPRTGCTFRVKGPGGWKSYAVDPTSVRCGSTTPYSHPGSHDWAVARLPKPVKGVTPYRLGGAGTSVRLVAGMHDDWPGGRSIEACRIRARRPVGGGIDEIHFDCSAGNGASGSAILAGNSDTLVGIFVGYRSTNPRARAPYSEHHYN